MIVNVEEFFFLAFQNEVQKLPYGGKSKLARDIGISPQSITDALNKRMNFSENNRRKIANYFNYDYDFFLKIGQARSKGQKIPTNKTDLLDYQDDSENYLLVNYYKNMKVSAGVGGYSPIAIDNSNLGIPLKLNKNFINTHNKCQLAAFNVGGDSMEPTIDEGSIIIVDLNDKLNIKNNNIYMLYRPEDDDVSIKRLTHLKNKNYLILNSDNHNYGPETINLEFYEYNLIIGKVILNIKKI